MLAALPGWLDPQQLIEQGGLWAAALVIFAESGLLIGFFLPGDSLLFVAGFLASRPSGLPALDQPLPLVLVVFVIAAVVGDQVGYAFGRRVGPRLFDRPRSRLFDPANVDRAHQFLERHGPRTIVLARFVPIVRTFAPIVAGVGRMHYRTFVAYNLLGGVLWGAGVTTLGYYLGRVELVREHVELAALVVVAVSLAPILVESIRHRARRRVEVVDTLADPTSPVTIPARPTDH